MKQNFLLALFFLIMGPGFVLAGIEVDFKFKDLDGKIYSPDTLKGSPVVLYVGSTF